MQGGTPFKGTVVTPSYTFKICKCCCFTTNLDGFVCCPRSEDMECWHERGGIVFMFDQTKA